jgi:hypothetical protein
MKNRETTFFSIRATSFGAMCLAWSGIAAAQTFNSGSTGADGAYAPSCSPTPCTVTETLPPDGIFNYTTVTIPSGVTVRYTKNAANTPVTILATGDVTINGTINVNGTAGAQGSTATSVVRLGAPGGPGGFNGGNGPVAGGVAATNGHGPGGGFPNNGGGSYGAPSNFVTLIPLFGGSGGGGATSATSGGVGSSGGGGGGAIVIASSARITIAGSVLANGATGGTTSGTAGAGSGGAIRLVGTEIGGGGTLQAVSQPISGSGGGGVGRIRLETFTFGFTGSINPAASFSVVPAPVTAASNPALIGLPVLVISSVGGVGAPALPGASFSQADVSLPQGTTNPVPVVVSASNMPVGSPTAITVRLIPQSGNPTNLTASGHTGTFASSTATANVTFPAGTVSVVQAWASTTLTGQIASLFPSIDGEPVERVLVAAADERPSTLSLLTPSGKEKRFDQLRPEDQLRVAQAWQALRETDAR